jgi:FKBP-type peptidyl-prolyl cis-trans isomerase FkpA
MKRYLIATILSFIVIVSASQTLNVSRSQKNNVIDYSLPDSVKAVSFLAEISISPLTTKKELFIGIRTDLVKLSFESDKNEKEIVFEFPKGSQIMAKGIDIKVEKDEFSWRYSWAENEAYRLMIVTAGDSAGNFSLYSGYIFLPKEKKWKLIGTCKIMGRWNTIKQPAIFAIQPNKTSVKFDVIEAWCQRQNGSWKNLSETTFPPPVVNLYSHVDSLQQIALEKKQLEIFKHPSFYKESGGVYYNIINEGNGRQVSVNDTVIAYYKGHLFSDRSLFDETKDKPATFPLNRLIKGWQIGVPLCKVGGKIELIIPSNLAYSIRTRAAKIPPNSILVFEIEVVDAKSPQ